MSADSPQDTLTGPELVASILDEVHDLFGRYVAFPSHHAHVAVTVWTLHAWTVEHFSSTPRLALLSPEPGSGKSRVLEVLELLTPNPMYVHDISTASMFRLIEAERPTVLLDEADAHFGTKRAAEGNEDLRALINAGHRKGSVTVRMEGQGAKMTPKRYSAYAAVALAGIGTLPETITSRAVVIPMRRRKPSEYVEPFEHDDAVEATSLASALLKGWADTPEVERLRWHRPKMPDGVVDRPADVWRPLVAIADHAGPEWSKRIRDAAVYFVAAGQTRTPSLTVRLLSDIRDLFERMDVDRLTSDEICRSLVAMPEAPWGDLYGREIDPRKLARMLSDHEIRSRDMKMPDGQSVRKGYMRESFEDSWSRYLAPSAATERYNATSPVSVDDSEDSTGKSVALPNATEESGSGQLRYVAEAENPEIPNGDRPSSGVADSSATGTADDFECDRCGRPAEAYTDLGIPVCDDCLIEVAS